MNCIVVDDEPIARLGMQDLIGGHNSLTLLQSFKSTVGVSDYLKTHQIDIIFLDIEMPGSTGLEFAAIVPEKTLVIFTTAYAQYALESYEVDALDYLIKPITEERFNTAITKATNFLNLLVKDKVEIERTEKEYIIIRADRKNHKVFYSDITYIEALKDYVIIFTKDTRYISWLNLKTIHAKLPQQMFVRISKSYVINHHHITSFDNVSIVINNIEIMIGRAYRENFFKEINL